MRLWQREEVQVLLQGEVVSEPLSSDPKAIAADIARELREHPERWTTGWCARDESGSGTSYDDDDAVCWCLMGHIMRRAPEADVYVIGPHSSLPSALIRRPTILGSPTSMMTRRSSRSLSFARRWPMDNRSSDEKLTAVKRLAAKDTGLFMRSDVAFALVECAEALKRNLPPRGHTLDCPAQSPGLDCDCGASALKRLGAL